MGENKLDPKIRALGKIAGINWSRIKFEYKEDEIIGISIEPTINENDLHYSPHPVFPLDQFQKLETLSISSKDISIQFKQKISIRILKITDTFESEVDFSKINDLEELYLHHNHYTHLNFGSHPKLRVLHIPGKYLDQIDFSQIPNLQELSIKDYFGHVTRQNEQSNRKKVTSPKIHHTIGKLKNLEKLAIYDGKFEIIDLNGFQNLRAIRFEGCKIDNLIINQLSNLRYLSVYYLRERPIIPSNVRILLILTLKKMEFGTQLPEMVDYFHFNETLVNKQDYSWKEVNSLYSTI